VKEVSYIHVEGFAGGELKHGALALIETGSPCIVFAPHDETWRDTLSAVRELKARGAVIVGVAEQPSEHFDWHFAVRDVGGGSRSYRGWLLRSCWLTDSRWQGSSTRIDREI